MKQAYLFMYQTENNEGFGMLNIYIIFLFNLNICVICIPLSISNILYSFLF
jgi:hypothetical protein